MENLKINDATRSRDEWMEIVGLPEDLRQNVMAADVLIVPSMIQDQPKAFMVGTMDLYALLKSHLGDKMEICIADEDYEEIELNSRTLRLGSFLVVSVALPLFLNLVGNYIYDRLTEPGPVVKEVDVPEYQQPATVSFTITVEDTLGKKKEFQYEGPAADYKKVAAEIQKMWNE
ncbi:hypothetical protein L6472_09915 [Prevotella sp. E13-17]|uniref:hypothetical protein n=1 Tax=Prevotella sp. E13-17 TaxID=2913616 RepID=UPI001EDC6F1E|nr:hypothetical protein [Prevotella sp. E13-17]UKK50335.1 hypothetical protein L6472_09915 [Prevotella sp. E13-17]